MLRGELMEVDNSAGCLPGMNGVYYGLKDVPGFLWASIHNTGAIYLHVR
jgi:hypothetical protein